MTAEIMTPTIAQGENFIPRMARATLESKAGRALTAVMLAGGIVTATGCDAPSHENTATTTQPEAPVWPEPYIFTQVSDARYGLKPGEIFTTIANFSELVPPSETAKCGRPCNTASTLTAWGPEGDFINIDKTVGYPIEAGPTTKDKGDTVAVICQIPEGKPVRDVRYRTSTVWDVVPIKADEIQPKILQQLPPEAKAKDYDGNPATIEVPVLMADQWLGDSGYRGKDFDCDTPQMQTLYNLGHLTLKRPN